MCIFLRIEWEKNQKYFPESLAGIEIKSYD